MSTPVVACPGLSADNPVRALLSCRAYRARMHPGRLDRDAPEPLYVQLAAALRDAIAAGRWERRLPSEPDLAWEFEVNRTTVRRAIAILAAEGVLTVSRGRGTFITGRPSP